MAAMAAINDEKSRTDVAAPELHVGRFGIHLFQDLVQLRHPGGEQMAVLKQHLGQGGQGLVTNDGDAKGETPLGEILGKNFGNSSETSTKQTDMMIYIRFKYRTIGLDPSPNWYGNSSTINTFGTCRIQRSCFCGVYTLSFQSMVLPTSSQSGEPKPTFHHDCIPNLFLFWNLKQKREVIMTLWQCCYHYHWHCHIPFVIMIVIVISLLLYYYHWVYTWLLDRLSPRN